MFARVVVLNAPPSGRAMPGGLAGIIELSDIAYQYAVPGSLGYEIGLYTGAQTETKACDEVAQRIHAMLTHNGPGGGAVI